MLKKYIKGFTFVELIVSVAIMTILTSIVLFNYGTFNDNLALSSTGQEMAIAIRQAQIYALNVKESTIGSATYSYAYGVYFDSTDSITSKVYYIFVDKNKNNKYDIDTTCSAVGTECVQKFTIRNGVKISSIDATGGCPGLNAAVAFETMFLRPSPDAVINFVKSNGGLACQSNADGKVVLISPKGKSLTVTVQNTGQIYVQ